MENRKYEFTGETKIYNGRELKRIKRLSDGLIGGWIEKEENLSHEGNCFVFDDAIVCDNARVCNDAKIYGDAWIHGNARIYDNVMVYEDAWIYDNAMVYGNAEVYDNAMVYGNAEVYGNAWIYGDAKICNNAMVYDNVKVYGDAKIYGNARICGNMKLNSGIIQTKCERIETYQSIDTRLVTALLTDNGWRFNVGCQELLTKEEFINRIHSTDGGLKENPHREFYLKILDLH